MLKSQSVRLIFAAIGLIVLGVAIAWFVASRTPSSIIFTNGPIVLVSGRDDHGLLKQEYVPLQKSPTDKSVVAVVHDGAFARVVEQRGEWLLIQEIKLDQVNSISGWINDFYLRNRALRVDGGGQVEFDDAKVVNNQIVVAIRPVAEPTATPIWMASKLLREIGAK